jgi:hypothetical protein
LKIHILGCGNFGRRALEYYAARPKGPEGCEIVLVDSEKEHLAAARRQFPREGEGCKSVCRPADEYLAGLLGKPPVPGRDWIIPTVPFHLAAAALCRVLQRRPRAWEKPPALPNLFLAAEGLEACSRLADFICPADCPQPRTPCYQPGLPREPSLLRILARLDYRLDGRRLLSLVMASTQVAPGLGGFPLQRLYRLMLYIRDRHPESLLFSTACRCHGVTSILGPAGDREP